MGTIINALVGMGAKVLINLIDHWAEQKRAQQLMIMANDELRFKALIENQKAQAMDPHVKSTRRVLFLAITFTLCFLMIFYAFNPNISYDVIVPKGETWKSGILSFFFGSKDWEVVRMTGGLMLASFMEIGQMVIAFYVVPPKR